MSKCPQCGTEVTEVVPVDIDTRTKLKASEPDINIPDQVCRSCAATYRRRVTTAGGVLLAQEKAKEERKQKLWKTRTSLVKQGHTQMTNQLYSEAAISYEKYIKLLEMIFECEQGQLNPKHLKEAAKTAELTVIAGVYWDLVRIYDTSNQYGDRQASAARQLALFLPFTPIFPEIIRKATVFQKNARHPEVIKEFLNSARKQRIRCFIATSAFEAPLADEVISLRDFRDQVLKKSNWGRAFVRRYYAISPSIACFLDEHAFLKPFVRAALRAVIKCVS